MDLLKENQRLLAENLALKQQIELLKKDNSQLTEALYNCYDKEVKRTNQAGTD
jgi:cell division protein FtsB